MHSLTDQIYKLSILQEKCDKLSMRKTMLIQSRKEKKKKIGKIKRQIRICIESQNLLIETGKIIQNRFKDKVDTIITNAIQAIYDYPYTFELRFEQKRNTIEAVPIVKKKGTELLPEDDLGGGILDVISLGFRIILWYLQDNRPRNVLFLDEPLKFLGNLSGKTGYMLKYLTKQFGIQVVMATHDSALLKICDRVYNISHNGTESIIKREIKRR